ncbi:hypothetical protein ACWC1D_25725 [Streptomyces sp. NPDC001478]
MPAASSAAPLTATGRADFMAGQILSAARHSNQGVVTVELVDAAMSRAADTEQGKVNPATVRRIIRRRAAGEGVRVILTGKERYWAIREQLHFMGRDQITDLMDSIAEGGDDDPRAWDAELVRALSAHQANRGLPEGRTVERPVAIQLWARPRPAVEERRPTAEEQQRTAANRKIADQARAVLTSRGHSEAQQGAAGFRFRVDAGGVRLSVVDCRGASWPSLLDEYARKLERRGWTAHRGLDVYGSHMRLVPPAETAPAPARPAADVLAADPVPAGQSVFDAMPGVAVDPQDLHGAASVLTHEAYVVQSRSRGTWTLPNHDTRAEVNRGELGRILRRFWEASARLSLDADGAVYASNGWEAARYIPTELLSDYRPGECPGCGTAYASNGDGPCPSGVISARRLPF